jgi:hypothetical protein
VTIATATPRRTPRADSTNRDVLPTVVPFLAEHAQHDAAHGDENADEGDDPDDFDPVYTLGGGCRVFHVSRPVCARCDRTPARLFP